MSRIEQILVGLREHLVTRCGSLADDDVAIAHRDDRLVTEDDVTPPKVTVALYDFQPAPDLDYSGYLYQEQIDIPNEVAHLTPKALPYRAFIQVDTFTRLADDDWQLQQEIQSLLTGKVRFTVNHGTVGAPDLQEYSVEPQPGDNQDDLVEGGYHKVLRLSTPVWLSDPRDLDDVALVLSVEAVYADQTITIEEETP